LILPGFKLSQPNKFKKKGRLQRTIQGKPGSNTNICRWLESLGSLQLLFSHLSPTGLFFSPVLLAKRKDTREKERFREQQRFSTTGTVSKKVNRESSLMASLLSCSPNKFRNKERKKKKARNRKGKAHEKTSCSLLNDL
jgi:hypothetical protein